MAKSPILDTPPSNSVGDNLQWSDCEADKKQQIAEMKTTKKYPTRKSSLGKITRKTPKSRKKITNKKVATNQQINVDTVRTENVVLRHSIVTLEKTLSEQGIVIDGLKQSIEINTKNIDNKIANAVAACENRIRLFYTDQDKICLERATKVSNAFTKKLDKTSTKAENAMNLAKTQSTTPLPPDSKETEEKIKNIQMSVEKLDHEVAVMGDHLNELQNLQFASSSQTIIANEKERTISPANTHGKPKIPDAPKPAPDNTKRGSKRSVMLCDSNRKHLVADQLWRGIEIIPCGSVRDLKTMIPTIELEHTRLLIINVGVNDLDKKDGRDVFNELKSILEDITKSVPHIKIVLSEITPRNDERDAQVIICNALLKDAFSRSRNVTIAHHNKLRNSEWSFHEDAKHLSRISIGKFAWNLKNAIRSAMGSREMQQHPQDKQPNRTNRTNNLHNQDGSSKYVRDDKQQKQDGGGKYMRDKAVNLEAFKTEMQRVIGKFAAGFCG